jgi:hypothetical protein
MKKKIKVYIASPYTKGDVAVNVRKSMDAFYTLSKKGFVPFSPIAMSHFIHMIYPLKYDYWLEEWDYEWVVSCDCLLRLEGESYGADEEIKKANEYNIPIFYSIERLLEYYNIEKDFELDIEL